MEILEKVWNWFVTRLSGDLLVNGIVAFVFWLIGLLGKFLIDFFRNLILKSKNKEIQQEYEGSIINFDTVCPCYEPELASMRLIKNRFVFEIPEDKRKELATYKTNKGVQKFAIHESSELDGDNHELYNFLNKYYSELFPNKQVIDEFINEKICSTADYFIERLSQGRLAFNNRQIGIDHFSITRTDEITGHGEEKQTIDIDLYETDYFTAQVMVHIYQHLRQIDHKRKEMNYRYESPFDNIDVNKLNSEMRHFMSSLGVGGYIIFNRGEGLEYWTVKRSSNVRNGSDKNMELRSYSFDETMDLRDAINDIKEDNVISVYEGANRAIQEELGLFNKRDEKVKNSVGDFHLTNLILIRTDDVTNARFEMQLLGYTFVHFTDDFTYNDLILKKKNAQDASFEAVTVYSNKLKAKLVSTLQKTYTHTPESVYYADTLKNMEDMKYIRNEYKADEAIMRIKRSK